MLSCGVFLGFFLVCVCFGSFFLFGGFCLVWVLWFFVPRGAIKSELMELKKRMG